MDFFLLLKIWVKILGNNIKICKNIGKNLTKNASGKYSSGMLVIRQKLLDHAERSATD